MLAGRIIPTSNNLLTSPSTFPRDRMSKYSLQRIVVNVEDPFSSNTDSDLWDTGNVAPSMANGSKFSSPMKSLRVGLAVMFPVATGPERFNDSY